MTTPNIISFPLDKFMDLQESLQDDQRDIEKLSNEMDEFMKLLVSGGIVVNNHEVAASEVSDVSDLQELEDDDNNDDNSDSDNDDNDNDDDDEIDEVVPDMFDKHDCRSRHGLVNYALDRLAVDSILDRIIKYNTVYHIIHERSCLHDADVFSAKYMMPEINRLMTNPSKHLYDYLSVD